MRERDAFFARPASDRDPNWPVCFVAKRSNPGRNVLAEACEVAGIERPPGVVLGFRRVCEAIAEAANEATIRRASL